MAGEIMNITELVSETNEALVHSPEWYRQMKDAIDYLIVHDFSRLVQVLYQADVPEEKLKRLLKENSSEDASVIIANMLLQRQLQKIEARRSFSAKSSESDEEKW